MHKITKGIDQLTKEAMSRIANLTPEEGLTRVKDDGHLLVDIRDVRELQRDGLVEGAYHAPRGMLEFWLDPDSPYHKPELLDPDGLVLYCGGGLRSALAADALQAMGHPAVSHITGGFAALKQSDAVIVPFSKREKSTK